MLELFNERLSFKDRCPLVNLVEVFGCCITENRGRNNTSTTFSSIWIYQTNFELGKYSSVSIRAVLKPSQHIIFSSELLNFFLTDPTKKYINIIPCKKFALFCCKSSIWKFNRKFHARLADQTLWFCNVTVLYKSPETLLWSIESPVKCG